MWGGAALSPLSGVTTKRLNEQVKRNSERFPSDFVFQLNLKEKEQLVANCDRFKLLKHSSSMPYAFTEHGALQLANVLKSVTAIEVSIQVVRTFTKIREVLASHKELQQNLDNVISTLKKHDYGIKTIFETIRQLLEAPEKDIYSIGFRPKEKT
ncbi:MAG: ORF6N domain-containing protein [Candidatus Margulisiibacteriota bacterium]